MKKVLLILSFAAVAAAGGAASEYRARRPRPRAQNLEMARRQPAGGRTRDLHRVFFHSSNPACIASLKRLKEITDKTGAKLRVIVVTKGRTPRKSRRCSGPISRSGSARPSARKKAFTAFGVTYVPFGVLTDARNRAMWMGNSLQFNEKLIEQTTR